jgi:hypothetical protein
MFHSNIQPNPSILYFVSWAIFFIVCTSSITQLTAQKTNVYLLSGQGSDERIYQEIDWDTSRLNVSYIPYLIPDRGETMNAYAHRMAESIDTTKPFSLVGVSLGGMISSEIKTFTKPDKVILISSAKCRSELPAQYRIQRLLPFYKLVPKNVLKHAALIAQPLFEPDRKSHKEVCIAMLRAKNKVFTKRSIQMIMNWDKEHADPEIIHIHGTNDNTLPIKRIKATHIVQDGSHMMALTRSKEVSDILKTVL